MRQIIKPLAASRRIQPSQTASAFRQNRSRLSQILDLFGEEDWRSVYAGELEARPPGALTIGWTQQRWGRISFRPLTVPALDNVLMPTNTVAELVNEARRASAEARDELVRRHHREATILAAAMVNDPTEAEDISQEASIRAFRNLDLLVDPRRFAAWAAANCDRCVDRLAAEPCIAHGLTPTRW
jgi:hypothetical protein